MYPYEIPLQESDRVSVKTLSFLFTTHCFRDCYISTIKRTNTATLQIFEVCKIPQFSLKVLKLYENEVIKFSLDQTFRMKNKQASHANTIVLTSVM
jgi:hypothetical protein